MAIGNNNLRETLIQQLVAARIEIASVIRPKAFVSPRAQVAVGASVMAGAMVDHQARVMEYGRCGLNVCMAGGSELGRSSWMKAGSSIGHGVVIPDGVTLQPGQAV